MTSSHDWQPTGDEVCGIHLRCTHCGDEQKIPPPPERPAPLPNPVVPDVSGHDRLRCYFCGARRHWLLGICLGGDR